MIVDGDVRSGVVDYHNDRRFLDHYGHTSADRVDRQQELKKVNATDTPGPVSDVVLEMGMEALQNMARKAF